MSGFRCEALGNWNWYISWSKGAASVGDEVYCVFGTFFSTSRILIDSCCSKSIEEIYTYIYTYTYTNTTITMPSIETLPTTAPPSSVARTRLTAPLSYTGSLDTYSSDDLTPVIGREYTGLQVKDLLSHPEADRLIRDLAVTVSQRGVVFLRDQDVTPMQMKALGEKMSWLAGCVSTSAQWSDQRKTTRN